MRRKYHLSEQAVRSRRIREQSPEAWGDFSRLWYAFNALYATDEVRFEEQKINRLVANISDQCATELLNKLDPMIAQLPNPPPGDTRFTDDDPRFRASSNANVAIAGDHAQSGKARLTALMAIVYQIRCNVMHGGKSAESARDNELVAYGLNVLLQVVPVIEDDFIQR